MDRDFGHLHGVNSHLGTLKLVVRTLELEAVIKVVFHFDEGYEWRFPGPDECSYHNPGDGYVGISLEQAQVSSFFESLM